MSACVVSADLDNPGAHPDDISTRRPACRAAMNMQHPHPIHARSCSLYHEPRKDPEALPWTGQ
jgi:hypothetical protein